MMTSSVQGFSQNREFVVPFKERPVMSMEQLGMGKGDDFVMAELGNLFSVLTASENRLAEENQKTEEKVELFFSQMRQRFAELVKENEDLRAQLIASEGRQRATALVHIAEVKALKDKLAIAEKSLKDARSEVVKVSQKEAASVAAEIAARKVAVDAANAAGDARVAAALAAQKVAVDAAINAGDARVDAALAAQKAAAEAAKAADARREKYMAPWRKMMESLPPEVLAKNAQINAQSRLRNSAT